MFRFAQHDTRRNPGMKRVGIVLLQLLVTGAGLWYVFHDQQKRAQIADALRQADRTWIIFGWLSYSAVEVLATVRWQMLLRIQGITLSSLRTFAIRHGRPVLQHVFARPRRRRCRAPLLCFQMRGVPQNARDALGRHGSHPRHVVDLVSGGAERCRAVSLVEPLGRDASYRLFCAGFARCWMYLHSVVVRRCSFRSAAQASETNAVSACNRGIR